MGTFASVTLAATINIIIFLFITSFDSQLSLSSSYAFDSESQYDHLAYGYNLLQKTILQQRSFKNETETNNPISFTVYHTDYSDSIMNVLKKHFSSPNTKNYLFEDTRAKAILGNFSSEYNFIIVGTSYNEITKNKFRIAKDYQFNSSDIVVYDIENRSTTPRYEKMDPVSSISQVMQTIRWEGYKAGITPDYEFITTYYKEIEWKNVDFLGIQIQRFTNNYELLLKWAAEISSFVKSKNPNTEVFIQLSFRHASNCYDSENNRGVDNACKIDVYKTLQVLKQNLSALAQLHTVDGFIISYPRHLCPAELCTPTNLDEIMVHIENIQR
jgi:hypothetical protein